MKKNICVMLALILLAGQSAFAAVDSEISDPVWRAENSGYTLRIPDAYREADGFISFSDAIISMAMIRIILPHSTKIIPRIMPRRRNTC